MVVCHLYALLLCMIVLCVNIVLLAQQLAHADTAVGNTARCRPILRCILYSCAVASLGWVTPGAETEGVTLLFFPEKPGDLF